MDLSAYRQIQQKNLTDEQLKRDLEYAKRIDESGLKAPNKIPIPYAGSQSNNPPSVSKQTGSGANAVGMASANLGAGVAKKQTIPVSQRQFGIGMQQTQAQPQKLPYADKVSASLPKYNAVTPSGGSKVPALPYYQAPGISSDTWKKQAEQMKEGVAQQQKTVRPWQNTSGTMQTASYMNPPQAFQKDGRAMSIEKPESVVRNEQKLADLKSSLANAQNQGYLTDYSEQWRSIESRDDAEDVKAKLARMASMKNNIGTDMGQNIASMNEYQRLRGELESKGINAEGVADWLRRNSNVMEAYYQQQRDIARATKTPIISPIVESLKTVPQSLYGGNGALAGMTQSAMNSRTGEYRPIDTMGDAFDIARARQTVRGTVGDNIGQWVYEKTGNQNMANTAKFLYGTAMSGADSWFMAWLGGTIGKIAATGGVPAAAATGVEAAAAAKTASDAIEAASAAAGVEISTGALSNISSIILGSNAATESVMDVVNRGGSTDQAVASGVLAWAAESIFEKVSIEGLITKWKSDKHGFKAFIKNAFLQGASEASEEMATEIANVIADYYVNGGLSEIEMMRQSGMSDVEITNEIAKRVGSAGAGGFLMGFGGGGTASAFNRTSLSLREQRALNALSEKTGVNIQIDDDIKGSNGYFDRNTNTLHISRNSNNAVYQVAAHEITHSIESNPTEWQQLYEIANANLSEDARSKLEYVLQKTGYTDAEMQSEVVSHYVQQCVTDINSFEQLVGVNRTLAQRIVDAFDSFVRKITMQRSVGNDSDTQYLREIMGDITPEQAQQTLAQMKKALAAGGQTTREGVQLSAKLSRNAIDTDGGEDYSHNGVGGILTRNEWGSFQQKVNDYKLGRHRVVYKTVNGELIFQVGDSFGVENTLVFTNGEDDFSIKKVVRIALDYETLIEPIREEIVDDETQYGDGGVLHAYEAAGLVSEYSNRVGTVYRGGREYGRYDSRNGRTGTKQQNGRRNAAEYKGTLKYSRKLSDQERVRNAAEAAGYNIHAYHGTGRADRVGNEFLPERATSGPMAFFTDSKEIAENYARDKRDTSLSYDDEYADYYTQFRVNKNGKSIKVQDLWNSMTPAQKQRVKEAGKHITLDDEAENIIWDENATHGLGNWDAYTLNMHRGNAIEALIDSWLESGELWNREDDFLKVLELAGITGVEYRDPDARYEKVYDTYLNIQNPFDTAMVDDGFLSGLEKWWEAQDQSAYERETADADMWDKNSMSVERWLEKARDDVSQGTSYAWTSIPDAVTDYLKSQGYDGIKDRGGKNGGEEHTVYIPFAPEQIKSAETVTMDDNGNVIPLENRFDPTQRDIRYSRKLNREALQEMVEWKRAGLPYAPGYVPKQQLPRAEQTQPQQIPYNPAAQATNTPAQPTLPRAEELNGERQKTAHKPNLPYSNQNMGIVASPELAAAMQPIVDYTTAKPNPEGSRNIEGSVLDNLGQGQSAFDTLDNLLAQSKADAAKKPGAKEGIANVLTDRPKKFSKENFAEQKDKVMRKVVDSGYTIDTIAKDVDDQVLYPLYNNAKQSRQAAEYMIGDAQTDINGNRVGESLVSIFKPVTDKGTDYFRDFSTYLYHMHNVDRMSLETNGAQIYQDAIMQLEMENPMLQNATREEVEALASGNSDYRESAIEWLQLDESLNNLQNKPVFGESITADDSRKAAAELLRKNPEFAELAEKVYAYNRNLMKYRVDSGLISQKQADIMNALYPHYVPTFRDTSSTTGMKISGNQARVARTVRGATGSNLDLMRIDDSMAEQTMQTIRAAKQNLLGARLLEDALKHQDKVGRHVRSVIDRYNSYDMDDPPQLGNDITIFVGGKPVSMQADDGVMEAFQSIQPRKGERIAGLEAVVKANNTFKALVTGANPMFLAKNFARDLQDAGLYAGNLKDFAKNYPKAWTEMARGGELWQLYKSQGGTGTSYFDYEKGILTDPNGNIISKTFNKIEQLNMMVEQAPRFAEFMAVLEKEGRTYEGIQKAMLAAADVTVNFGRGGTATQFLNRTFVPFLNPAVQGADKLVRRFAHTKGAKEWMGLIGRLVLLGIGPALLNELLYDDEEEYQMLNDRDKENNFVFPIGDGIWVKVPKGRALSVFGSAAQRGVRAAKGDKDAFNGFISQAYEQVGVPNPLADNIFSQIMDADLFDEESPGKTWYGSDIEPQRLQGLPVAERYDEKTDELSKWLGKQLNVSPKKINYLLDNYSGVIGDFLLPYSTPQAERGGIFAPVVSAFSIDSVTNNKLSGEFYDKLDELEQAKNSGNPTAGAAAAYRYMNSVASDISANNKEIREIQADTTINDKEKLEKVRKLRTTNNTLFKDALDSVPAYMEAAGKSGVVSDKELDKVYLDTNRKQFGAEYALEKYNKKVYEKAQKANKSLISYESFYDAYFAQKDVTGDKDKNGKTIALSESGNKKLAIDKATPGLTQKQREVLYDMFDVSKSVWNGYIPNRK